MNGKSRPGRGGFPDDRSTATTPSLSDEADAPPVVAFPRRGGFELLATLGQRERLARVLGTGYRIVDPITIRMDGIDRSQLELAAIVSTYRLKIIDSPAEAMAA